MAPTTLDIRYDLHLYKGKKFFVANCPSFRITTQGKTVSAALKNFNDALQLCLEDEQWCKFYGVSNIKARQVSKRGRRQAPSALGA